MPGSPRVSTTAKPATTPHVQEMRRTVQRSGDAGGGIINGQAIRREAKGQRPKAKAKAKAKGKGQRSHPTFGLCPLAFALSGDQGSSAFFWEIRRRIRSASRAPSNGF